MMATAVLLSVCLPVFSQDLPWKRVPAEYRFVKLGNLAGQSPTSVAWNDRTSGRWRVTFEGIGDPDPDGIPTVMRVVARSPEGAQASIVLPSTAAQNFLPALMAPGVYDSISKVSLGVWDLWAVSIDPVTNGDPPLFYLWTILHRPTGAITLEAAVGRGIVAYAHDEMRMAFLFLTQEDAAIGKRARHLRVALAKGHLSRQEGYPIDVVWRVDAPHPLIPDPIDSSFGERCLLWTPVSFDGEGGEATPVQLLPQTPWNWIRDVPGLVDRYSKDDLQDPPPLAATANSPLTFRWSETLQVLLSPLYAQADPERLVPQQARERLSTGQWALLLARRTDGRPTAYAIVKMR